MIEFLSASVVALCVTKGKSDCGIKQEVFQNGKSIGSYYVSYSGVAEQLSEYLGERVYTIAEADFQRLWASNIFQYDIEYILPNDPVEPQTCNVEGKFEFVTRIKL